MHPVLNQTRYLLTRTALCSFSRKLIYCLIQKALTRIKLTRVVFWAPLQTSSFSLMQAMELENAFHSDLSDEKKEKENTNALDCKSSPGYSRTLYLRFSLALTRLHTHLLMILTLLQHSSSYKLQECDRSVYIYIYTFIFAEGLTLSKWNQNKINCLSIKSIN